MSEKKEDIVKNNKKKFGEIIPVISSFTMSASELVKKYPPKVFNSKKKICFKISMDKSIPFEGEVKFSKFTCIKLPKKFPSKKISVTLENNFFTYVPSKDTTEKTIKEFYQNFADSNLFGFYYGPLFAQDEIQVTEIPILASVREYLLKVSQKNKKLSPKTRDGYTPTPCIIENTQVRISFDTTKHGLYGNKFSYGSKKKIEESITVHKKPVLSNIIAIEAPRCKSGNYMKHVIRDIISTAYSAYNGAKLLSKDNYVILHTGNWGCGAFGGNRTIMAIIQMCAAQLAGIDKIVYHCGVSSKDVEEGKKVFESFNFEENTVNDFIDFVFKKEYKWGFGDGN